MDNGYVIARLGATVDLIDLARLAADQLADREPGSALARELRGAAADISQPAFS